MASLRLKLCRLPEMVVTFVAENVLHLGKLQQKKVSAGDPVITLYEPPAAMSGTLLFTDNATTTFTPTQKLYIMPIYYKKNI